MSRLDGKRVLITGAGGGIGRATCKAFAREGARLVVTDVSQQMAEEVAADLDAEAVALGLDVGDAAGWAAALAVTADALGGLDVLVNNAGIFQFNPLEELSLETFQLVMSVNVHGPFLGMKAAWPMLADGGGAIVNLASLYSIVGVENVAAYCASKGAVGRMTKSAALEGARLDPPIRVNNVNPGPIDTGMLRNITGDQTEALLEPFIPVGRLGQPEDIAEGIVFLASDEADAITGADLKIDGGVTAF
ncbi:MAG: SDR family oxidoreductase [Pseudomonadota bacterium]